MILVVLFFRLLKQVGSIDRPKQPKAVAGVNNVHMAAGVIAGLESSLAAGIQDPSRAISSTATESAVEILPTPERNTSALSCCFYDIYFLPPTSSTPTRNCATSGQEQLFCCIYVAVLSQPTE